MSEQLKAFLEAAQYRITGGERFLWNCFGPNARFLETELNEDVHATAIFDSKTHLLYEVNISTEDDSHIPYRWINEDYLEAYKAEAISRDVDYKTYCDDRKWADTDTFEDIIEKVRAIYAGEEYDTRVIMQIDMPDDLFALCAKAAHDRDVTFNRFIEIALQAAIDEAKLVDPSIDNEDDSCK